MRRARKNRRRHHHPEDRQTYLDSRHVCEIIHLFPKIGPSIVEVPLKGLILTEKTNIDPFCVHHVGSGIRGNLRWDYIWNFAAICHTSHQFCEDQWGGETADGFVLCRKAKVDSGTWDETEMAKFIDCDHPLEWLQTRKIEHEFARRILEGMIQEELKGGEM